MSDDNDNKLATVSIQSLEILEQRRAELEQRSADLSVQDERFVTANDRVLFAVLIQQLRSAHELNGHLVKTIAKIEELERDSKNDREIVQAIMRDHGETRRLVHEHTAQITILASTLDVAFTKLGDVIKRAEQQAHDLREEASLRDR